MPSVISFGYEANFLLCSKLEVGEEEEEENKANGKICGEISIFMGEIRWLGARV